MIKIKGQPNELYKTIDAYQLESACREGWVVVGALSVSEIESRDGTLPATCTNNAHYHTGSVPVTTNHVVTKTQFLLRLEATTVIVALDEMIHNLQTDLESIKRQLTSMTTSYASATSENRRLQEQQIAASEHAERMRNEVAAINNKWGHALRDIRVLREAFGSLRVEEVFAAVEKK